MRPPTVCGSSDRCGGPVAAVASDLSSSERLGVGVLVLAIIGLGVWPNGVLNLMAPAVQALAAAWQG